MLAASCRRILALASIAGSSALVTCGIASVDVTGKRCPCPAGYYCDAASATCRPGSAPFDAGADAGGDAADAGAEGAGDAGDCPPPAAPSAGTIASGALHFCAIDGGALRCVGKNQFGQLGNGTSTDSPTPVQVGTTSDYAHVSALFNTTCAIRENTRLSCWGDNQDAQVGIGNVLPQPAPVDIDVNRSWAWVSSGAAVTCGVTLASELFCWGSNAGGAAGTGQYTGLQQNPYPVKPTVQFASAGAGSGNGCAIAQNGRLYCWGQGDCGKTALDPSPATPTEVGSKCWREVDGGHRHSCAIDTDGNLFCFGQNEVGELGIGQQGQGESDEACSDYYLEPQPVMPGEKWRTVSVGYLSTCAITEAGRAYCWGLNDWNNVADAGAFAPTPVALDGTSDWNEVAPGFHHTCARKQNGDVYCRGSEGSLGFAASSPLVPLAW